MTRFTALDAIVLIVYLVGTTALGLWVGRRQRDAKDYFVADRAIPWWAVMLSIVASETSALTFISTPGLSYGNAPGFGDLGFLQIVAGYIVGRFVVAAVLLPRYFQGNLVTAYALLETRFGLATRRFTSIVFMVTRGLADSVRVFATAIPVALIIGPSVTQQGVRDADRRAAARLPHGHLHLQGRDEGGRVDGARPGDGLHQRRRRRADRPRQARAGRVVDDLVERERRGQDAARSTSRSRCRTRTPCGRA